MRWYRLATVIGCVLPLAAVASVSAAWAQGAIIEELAGLGGVPQVAAARSLPPPHADNSVRFPDPGDQGRTSTCVAWATAYAAWSYEYSRTRRTQRPKVFSPAFVYNNVHDDAPNCDRDTKISQALESLRLSGTTPAADFPFNPESCARKPGAGDLKAAEPYRISGWSVIDANDLGTVKAQLADGRAVIVAMPLTVSFRRWHGRGVYEADENPTVIDGHAMVLTGYDDARGALRLINSFGNGWGEEGFGWISYRRFITDVRVGYVID